MTYEIQKHSPNIFHYTFQVYYSIVFLFFPPLFFCLSALVADGCAELLLLLQQFFVGVEADCTWPKVDCMTLFLVFAYLLYRENSPNTLKAAPTTRIHPCAAVYSVYIDFVVVYNHRNLVQYFFLCKTALSFIFTHINIYTLYFSVCIFFIFQH